jgi:hypothetical protein
MNKKELYQFLGIYTEPIKTKGNPFRTFTSDEEKNKYLLQVGVIDQKEYFLRCNPELRCKPTKDYQLNPF